MFYLHLYTYFSQVYFSVEQSQTSNNLNIHCRNDDNSPVDWWYLYKPPVDMTDFKASDRNYIYITSESSGHWNISDRYITSNSMLQHTLWPILKQTHVGHLAVIIYAARPSVNGSSVGTLAYGVLMADEIGGVWFGHSVPGFPDLTENQPIFPREEMNNGHLMMCLSVDLATVNELAIPLREVSPHYIFKHVPKNIRRLLPDWYFPPKSRRSQKGKKKNTEIDFLVSGDSFASVMVRLPGEKKGVYMKFAKNKKIVLDVYGQTKRHFMASYCGMNYSVRNIESISLKFPEKVIYIGNKNTDRSRFAVSTAAHWQRSGSGPVQYWTCVSNLDKDDLSGTGGLIVCVENYTLWLSFDNFKVKEPEC